PRTPAELYTLSLHDALPIFRHGGEHGLQAIALLAVIIEDLYADHAGPGSVPWSKIARSCGDPHLLHSLSHVGRHAEHHLCSSTRDRKSTRLNSSHVKISYAV